MIFCLLLILVFVFSCNPKVDVFEEWKDITVIYGLLNQSDSIQYIRVSKSFAGYGNSYDMAKVPDSFFYKPNTLVAYMEEWLNNKLNKIIELKLDSTIKRNEGVFSNEKNYYFYTKEPLNANATYKLFVKIKEKIVFSETNLIPGHNLVITKQTTNSIVPVDNNYIKIDFTTPKLGKIYQCYLRFFYYEVFPNDTVKKYLDMHLYKGISQTTNGNEIISFSYPSISFYENLANYIKETDNLLYRVVAKNAVQIIIYVGSQDLYAYMQSTEPTTSVVLDKPIFTNIKNGIGIFTSRYTKYGRIDSLTQRTVDSIAYSKYTKHLKFLDFYNSNWNVFN